MATTPITRLAKSNSNAWTVAATGPCEIDSINYSATAGAGQISVDVTQGGTTAMLLAPADVAGGASGRVRAGVIALADGNTLRVRSSVPVDWVISGVEPEA